MVEFVQKNNEILTKTNTDGRRQWYGNVHVVYLHEMILIYIFIMRAKIYISRKFLIEK